MKDTSCEPIVNDKRLPYSSHVQLYWTWYVDLVNTQWVTPVKKFELLKFVPFRLNRLAAEISAELSSEYRDAYGLDIPEWRVLATLGYHSGARSAQYVVHCTRTHKSTISRAVISLIDRELVARLPNDDDRRERLLCLTPAGKSLFDELVPKLLKKEQAILSCLSSDERQTLAMLLDKIEKSMDLL
jgi:DNA-binding MarR family transcriptional regulator